MYIYIGTRARVCTRYMSSTYHVPHTYRSRYINFYFVFYTCIPSILLGFIILCSVSVLSCSSCSVFIISSIIKRSFHHAAKNNCSLTIMQIEALFMQIEAQIAGETQAYIPAQAVAPFTLQMTLIVPLTLLMFERRPAQSQKDGFRKPHSLPAQFTAQNPLN